MKNEFWKAQMNHRPHVDRWAKGTPRTAREAGISWEREQTSAMDGVVVWVVVVCLLVGLAVTS